MKVRILGNSIRIRIQRGELDTLASEGYVKDQIEFGPTTLTYSLTASTEFNEVDARYEGDQISVFVPKAMVDDLVQTDRVGVSHKKPINDHETLSILVEKDFKCLTPRSEDSDAFPHPEEQQGSC